MLVINTRLVKIHGFMLAELMFEFRPKGSWMQQLHNDENPKVEDSGEYMPYLSHLYIKQRSELQEDARATIAITYKKMEAIQCSVWMTPKERDLVLLWNT